MDTKSVPRVDVLWRPGCPFCSRLRRGLDRAGVATVERHIWADPSAAARVREATGSDEMVPTVVIGGQIGLYRALRTTAARSAWVGDERIAVSDDVVAVEGNAYVPALNASRVDRAFAPSTVPVTARPAAGTRRAAASASPGRSSALLGMHAQ